VSADEEELRHKPFAEFGESLKKQLRRERRQALRDRLSRSAPVAPPAPPPPAPPPLSEEELLRQELQGVQPLAGSNYVPPQREAPPLRPRDDEAEAMAALADLVDGRALFDLAESDEYIEGIGQGLN